MNNNKLLLIDELKKHWQNIDFYPFEHQLEVANKVINELNGKALLADEVGLGKTIEAGIILKEYILRQEIKSCLILTPASLALQWWQELNNKFKLDLFNNRKGRSWNYFDIIISSIDRAKLSPHREKVIERNFDMVIVDEAQKLKNKNTKNWQFINSLKPKRLLLLTATPLQNNLKELINILSLLRPELSEQLSLRDKEKRLLLKEILDKFMLRNSRTEIKENSKQRRVKSIFIEADEKEEKIYQSINKLNLENFSLITLKREFCSSPLAAIKTIDQLLQKNRIAKNVAENLIVDLSKIQENKKVETVKEIIKKGQNKKYIIFTRYLASQHYLAYHLSQLGYRTYLFNGQLSDNKKELIKRLFRDDGDILISTQAGGEGINLQFCNQIINYDLSWNPMKLEQRAGRVHRFGQDEDVVIYNLITTNTIEERLEQKLKQKINLFEEIVGELEKII